jgi:2-iminobutanoate/2-iminopropanoate deaminase
MEKKRRDYADIAPAGPNYVRAIRAGDWLFISGCTARGTDAQGGQPVEQLKATLERIVRIVVAEGGAPEDIVKFTTYVTSISDWYPVSAEQQAEFDRRFGGKNPTNTLVEITALAQPGLDIEIEATALLA